MTVLIDRIPSVGKSNRKLITPEGGGTPYYAKVEYADDPIVVGTPINKQNMLDTVKLVNRDITSVGDIWTTGKNLTADNRYLPCDGNIKLSASYPVLAPIVGIKYGIPFGDWVNRTGLIWTYVAIKWLNNRFVAIGDAGVKTSTDGITWSNTGWSSSITNGDITFGNNKYVVVVGTSAGYSTDLTTWAYSSIGTFAPKSITYGDGLFVAVGDTGKIFTSSDAITWTARTSNTTDNLKKIIYAKNMFVVSGTSVVISSPNGITWTTRTIPSGVTPYYQTYFFYGNNKFWLSANDGKSFVTSIDGITWIKQSTALTTAALGFTMYDDVSKSFLSVGSMALSSTDGINWNFISQPLVLTSTIAEFYNGIGVVAPNTAAYTLQTINLLSDRFYLPADTTKTMWIRAVE